MSDPSSDKTFKGLKPSDFCRRKNGSGILFWQIIIRVSDFSVFFLQNTDFFGKTQICKVFNHLHSIISIRVISPRIYQ